MDLVTVLECSSCGRTAGDGDAFCEYCGAELTPAVVSAAAPGFVPSCPVCAVDPSVSVSGVTPDGYCESCGRKVPAGRDHVVLDLDLLHGVTDRGLRHSRNEDAMALATVAAGGAAADGPVAIAVVCDGVSSSPRPDDASLAAAQAAVREVLTSIRLGEAPPEASRYGIEAAAEAVADLARQGEDGFPATTYVSAVVSASRAVVCWTGDSRAYWLATPDPAGVPGSRGGSSRLTTDDSLATGLVESGLFDEAQAMATPQAHVLTRWLGADMGQHAQDGWHVAEFTPQGAGVLLVCTDGLWNYQPDADGLAALALPRALTDPAGAADALLTFALDAGGMDNITLVLIPFPLTSRSASS